uniref:Fibronectin type-III domain-containing protein n=1 Tax=Rodentolepis nana TaxID=102285 RepID=A0A0R3TF33_RODNA
LVKAQSNRDEYFSFITKSVTTFPGNHTLVAFTNNAQYKNATHPIIMPDMRFSVPSTPKIDCYDSHITVRWYKPKRFGDFCHYIVEAISSKHNASQETQPITRPRDYASISVNFNGLLNGITYEFYITTQCNSSRVERIKVGEKETNPGYPGTPQNPQLILLDPKTVNFTWNPPVVFRGSKRTYSYECNIIGERAEYDGEVTECYVLLKNVLHGNISCKVQAVSKTLDYSKMRGLFTKKVILEIPSPDTPIPQPIQLKGIDETTLELNLMKEYRENVIGHAVSIDSDLKISFLTGGEIVVNKTGLPTTPTTEAATTAFQRNTTTPQPSTEGIEQTSKQSQFRINLNKWSCYKAVFPT